MAQENVEQSSRPNPNEVGRSLNLAVPAFVPTLLGIRTTKEGTTLRADMNDKKKEKQLGRSLQHSGLIVLLVIIVLQLSKRSRRV